ncbi:MAG TPA: ATP-binding protein [Gemmatimonadales bacterium]|jgi:two-component system NtrC family sensor kinase
MTDPGRMVPPPLAVIAGAAKALAGADAPTDRLRALCQHLRLALPAAEVRFRGGARRSDRTGSGEGTVTGLAPLSVTIPWRDGRVAVLEVVDSPRPLAELRPILETVAALLATVLPALDVDEHDDGGVVSKLHRLTVDSLPVGLYVIDREYRVVLWNRKRETGTQGLRRGDVLGKRVLDILRRQPPETLRAEFDFIFATGDVRVSEQEVHVGNEVRTYRTSRLPMRLDGTAVSHVITIGEDVTETRAIQRAMHQTEKLAAVGQLAAGVMHEINNPLATIGGCVAAIASRVGNAEPVVKEYLEMIESEVTRCTNIIDGLLDFSRAGRAGGSLEPADINGLIDRTLALLKHHQRFRRLHVTRDYQDPLPRISGNAERLIQAAMAILLNAADATGGKGNVVVRTRSEGSMVVAEFEDDGPGIPADVVPKIFDPFFTTKGPARGTGLGLAICYGIVADHQGQLDVRSEPGVSTVFRMAIPAMTEETA